MKKIITLIFTLSSFYAIAQQQKGDLSIQFSGNYMQQKYSASGIDFKFGGGNIYLKLGKYFTQNLELGIKPNLAINLEPKIETTGDKTTIKSKLRTNLGFGVYGTYSFLTSDGKFLPYVGAELAYAPLGDEQSVNLGPYCGLKYFVTERINIDGNLSFLLNLGTSAEESKDYQVGPMFNYNIGIGVLIGKLND